MSHSIKCRARISARCLDGQPTRKQFGEDLPMGEDGTYDGQTIVCDACYVALVPLTPSGQGLNRELSDAIRRAREARA
jgi:hypothetical protein